MEFAWQVEADSNLRIAYITSPSQKKYITYNNYLLIIIK